jgi:hypothetical protein
MGKLDERAQKPQKPALALIKNMLHPRSQSFFQKYQRTRSHALQ